MLHFVTFTESAFGPWICFLVISLLSVKCKARGMHIVVEQNALIMGSCNAISDRYVFTKEILAAIWSFCTRHIWRCLWMSLKLCFRFGGKEQFMTFMNDFVSRELSKMHQFLKYISVCNKLWHKEYLFLHCDISGVWAVEPCNS